MDGSISTCTVLHEPSTLAVAIVVSELPRRTVVTNGCHVNGLNHLYLSFTCLDENIKNTEV